MTTHADGSARMRDLVAALPRQLRESADLAGLADVAAGPTPVRVVLCGMGGSAIAGDLLAPLLAGVQLVVHRDYGLPAWVRPDDLVVASSYSGETAETLSAWDEAGRRGCPRLAVTSGGRLAAAAAAAGVPRVALPGGLPPRASLGYGLGALARALARRGLLPDGDEALAAAADLLGGLSAARLDTGAAADDGAGNPHPRRVAADLQARLAVIHSAGALAHAPGRRLQAQLNENAKVPALRAAYPELDHNDLVGWEAAAPQARDRALLVLEDAVLPPFLRRRVDVTCGLVAAAFAAVHHVRAAGAAPLARVLSLVQYGDALSWHLADLRGVDPVPVAPIEHLKRALAAAPAEPDEETS